MSTSPLPLEYWAENGTLPGSEEPYESALYWMWLAGLLGPANLHAGRLVEQYGSARAAWEDRETKQFVRLAGHAAARALQQETSPAEYAPMLAWCRGHGITVLAFDDPRFPLALTRIPDPPLVLYCTGDVSVLCMAHTVGIVGARRPTQYGVAAAGAFGDALAGSGAVIVSGLADGLDSEGHRAAVRAGVPTIAVQGVPINLTYPALNSSLRNKIETCGVVISEYAPGRSSGLACTFLQRNRIIAALSEALVVIEARTKSGTMSTVSHAERYGRPIYAVPGSIFSPLSEGTNTLLRENRAGAATAPEELVRQLGLVPLPRPQQPETEQPKLPEQARRVLACIGVRPVGIQTLCEQTGLPMAKLLGSLSRLEVAGAIQALPGQHYVVK